MTAPRITKARVGRWQRDLEKAHALLERVQADVRACAANPPAKHYASLSALRTETGVALSALESAYDQSAEVRA